MAVAVRLSASLRAVKRQAQLASASMSARRGERLQRVSNPWDRDIRRCFRDSIASVSFWLDVDAIMTRLQFWLLSSFYFLIILFPSWHGMPHVVQETKR
jgi:hypothetical protein